MPAGAGFGVFTHTDFADAGVKILMRGRHI